MLRGHGAVFNSLSEDMGGWKERIWPGAFDGVMADPGVYALWNHDPNFIIAAAADHTLRLSQDAAGLLAEMDPMNTQTIRDLVVTPIQQGKVRKMSFAFDVGTAEWSIENSVDIREIRSIARLYDVSPVTYPAYPGTDISARTLQTLIRSLPREKIMRLLADMNQEDCEAQGGTWDDTEGMCEMQETNTSSAAAKAGAVAGLALGNAGALIEVYRRRAGARPSYDFLERKYQ